MDQRRHIIAPILPLAGCLIAGIAVTAPVLAIAPILTDGRILLIILAALIVITSLYRYHPRLQTAGIYLCTFVIGLLLTIRPEIPKPLLLQNAETNMLHYRAQLLNVFMEQDIGADDYAVLAAMTLGDKSGLTPEIREVYNITGAGHILALSGLHLGILYMLISLITVGSRWRMASQIVTILSIWAFAMLTGLSPSVVRSATMLTVYGLLSIGQRQGASINVLAFTAIIMLAINPQSLWDIGFQMSFMSVLSILAFFPMLNELIPLRYQQHHYLVRILWSTTLLSITAQLGVAPLIAFYFHRAATYFLLANFVVVPCAYVILIGALVLLITGWPPVASLLVMVISGMNEALQWIAALPFSSFDGLHLVPAQVVLIYVIIACLYVLTRIFIPKLCPTPY